MLNDTPHAVIVPIEARQDFLPTLFGRSHLIVAENAVYALMERLSPLDYRGGSWDFYEHQGKPLFLAPRSRTRFRITGDVKLLPGRGLRRGSRHHRHDVRIFAPLIPVPVRSTRRRL